ncbi:nitrous oxide reductase accessory protein NosL [Paenibacillus terrigena]|uniref:nitrous oxide reductase accessory protein NosL n=1 Tax=Paenibacillus terrigena TaxID=369333 RepID=UPI0003616F2F|nr:nitrous oxide reductase accessory protein NosL [Paenibacillus terrigena]
MKKLITVCALFLGLIMLAGCGDKYEALPINEDTDVCAICNMQVKDDAFATQLTTKDGKNVKFDDIGCMHKWKEQQGTENIGMDYVRDYNNKEWIEYDNATYVYDASFRTPMAYGIITFKDKKSAETFVSEQGVGKIMNAKELASHDWKQNTDKMQMMDEDGHMHKEDQKGMDMKSEMTSSHK